MLSPTKYISSLYFVMLKINQGTKFSSDLDQQLSTLFKEFGEDLDWDLSEQCYSTKRASDIFMAMIETNVASFHAGQNNEPGIIKDISQVKFWELKILGLPQNRICSIEILSTMYFPNLEGLNLFDNCITSIKPFRKMYSPNLFVVSLEQNFITDFTPLVQMCNHKQFREIGINYMQDTLCCDDFSWLIKVDNNNFNQLWIGEYNRIRMRSLEEVCKKKFKSVNLIICNHN